MITLTVQQIKDLAEFAGLTLHSRFEPDEFLMQSEITIADCPPEGIRNDGEESDPDSVSHYDYIAYCTDYPEEGCIGLGPEVRPNG